MRIITILIIFAAAFFIFLPSGVKADWCQDLYGIGSGKYACNFCTGRICTIIGGQEFCDPGSCCTNCRCCNSDGSGGGGDDPCISCTTTRKCRRADNCPGAASNQGNLCGYTKTRPQVAKFDCKTKTCVYICDTCTATAPDTPILLSPASEYSSCSSTTTCRSIDNCPGPATNQTSHCGWTTTLPVVEKKWCEIRTCVNNKTQIRKWVDTAFSWNAIGNWGANCTDPNNSYNLCISSGLASCDLVDEDVLSTETQGIWAPAEGNPNVTWSVTANNGALTSTSEVRNVCVEGFNIGDPSYLSNWSACTPGNEHTRTCREDCGTDDCAGQILTESCNLGSWWQTKDSDVQSVGDLNSMVPSLAGTYFGLAGDGGFPGVSSYGETTNLTGANVSSKGWLADSPVTNSRVYNYAYFTNQIPSDILSIINNVDIDVSGSLNTGGTPANGYYWYKYDGAMNANQPLTIPATNIGTRKVILLVDNADVNIIGNINLTDGQGFFLLIVRGSINVDPIVGGGATPNLEGLYFADTTFTDGVGNTQLTIRGSIVANRGVSMQRDLGADNTPPSELFEYAPDQIMLFPKIIGTRKMEWKEVAP